MNVAILGGLGFLGKKLSDVFAKTDNVYIIDRIPFESENYIQCELRDSIKIIDLLKKLKIDTVVHCISSLLPSSSATDYLNEINNIYIPTNIIIKYCAESGIKFVYLSSGGAIYGTKNQKMNEQMDCAPVSFYGLSKLNLENLIKYYHQSEGLKYLIIRPSNPYGYGQNLQGRQGVIAVVIGKILRNEVIEIWGDGTAIKDYIYIDDFSFYVKRLIISDSCWNDVYNIGTGIGYSVNDVIDTFRKCGVKLPTIIYKDSSSSDVKKMILDCNKLNQKIPHTCISLEEGIKKFLWSANNE